MHFWRYSIHQFDIPYLNLKLKLIDRPTYGYTWNTQYEYTCIFHLYSFVFIRWIWCNRGIVYLHGRCLEVRDVGLLAYVLTSVCCVDFLRSLCEPLITTSCLSATSHSRPSRRRNLSWGTKASARIEHPRLFVRNFHTSLKTWVRIVVLGYCTAYFGSVKCMSSVCYYHAFISIA